MDFYAFLLFKWVLRLMRRRIFLFATLTGGSQDFMGKEIQEALIPYHWSADWIDAKLHDMITLLNSTEIPDGHPSCKNCAYAKRRAEIEAY